MPSIPVASLARLAAIAWTALVVFAGSAPVQAEQVKKSWQRAFVEVAIGGYDPVAYFTEGRAAKGNPSIAHTWDDSTWHFSTPEHRELFAADPERYAPQFGGYCASAMTVGMAATADPEAWAIVDGKLYLTYSTAKRQQWQEHARHNIAEAAARWQAVKAD